MNRMKTVFAAIAFAAAGSVAVAPLAQAATGWDQVVSLAVAQGISNVTPAPTTPAAGITQNFRGTDANGNPVYGWVTSTGKLYVSKVDLSNPSDESPDA